MKMKPPVGVDLCRHLHRQEISIIVFKTIIDVDFYREIPSLKLIFKLFLRKNGMTKLCTAARSLQKRELYLLMSICFNLSAES